jgi:hypothetical protein
MVKKRIEYYIDAMTVNGAHITLVKGLENEEGAKALLAKIMERVTQRKGRYVSLGDVVFDPSPIVAYTIREWDVWDPEDDDHMCAVAEGAENEVEVIDLNAPAEADTPASDEDIVDEVL